MDDFWIRYILVCAGVLSIAFFTWLFTRKKSNNSPR